MAALDAYAPDRLARAQSAIDREKGKVSIAFSNLSFTTRALGDGTLVQVGPGLTVDISADGAHVSYANGCVTVDYQGRTDHQCRSQDAQAIDRYLQALPAPVRPIFERLTSASPDDGVVTVEENGSWFVSPVRTALQAVSSWLALFQASDIQTIISSLPAMKADVQKYLQQLGADVGGRAPSLAPLGLQAG
jgi:hypothetical protein